MNPRRFDGEIARLRSPERLARLEVERVIPLCLEGSEIHSVLDIGVGSAVFAEAFAARGLAVTGIDVNPGMIAIAQEFVPEGFFKLAPAEAVPFAAAAFDLAFLGLVLHEADDPQKALQEAKRVSSQRVVVLEWPYEEAAFGPPLAHRFPTETLRVHFKQAGFTHIHSERLSNLVLYRLEWDGAANRVPELQRQIEELKKNWPAHSAPGSYLQRLEDLEDELARIEKS